MIIQAKSASSSVHMRVEVLLCQLYRPMICYCPVAVYKHDLKLIVPTEEFKEILYFFEFFQRVLLISECASMGAQFKGRNNTSGGGGGYRFSMNYACDHYESI